MANRTPDNDQDDQRMKELEVGNQYLNDFTWIFLRPRLPSSPSTLLGSQLTWFNLHRPQAESFQFGSDSWLFGHIFTNQVGNNGRYMRPITLATGFKFLLVAYLAQKMLPSDVLQLKDFVTQNFLIRDVSNATTMLFQLEEDGILNAFGLEQLEQFFESIVRFDLAFVIHEFLLGDYSLLCQIPEVANRAITSAFHLSTIAGASDSHHTNVLCSYDQRGYGDDKCCMCLKDVSPESHMLPCCHKVHRNCKVQMTRGGSTHCPVCLVNIADTLESSLEK